MLNILEKLLGFIRPVTSVVSGLLSPAKIYMFLGTAAIIGVLSYTTYHYHKAWQSEITSYQVLLAQNAALVDMIKADKAAVDKYKAEADDRAAKAAADLLASQKQATFYALKAQNLLLAMPADADLCKSADLLFDQYIGDK